MKPNGSFQLDLTRREERLLFKIIATLSINEPGNHFVGLKFQWDRSMEPIPGFELTKPWMSEDGLPRNGIFNLTYVNNNGKGALINLRKALLSLVLILF